MLTLRPYQQAAIDAIYGYFAENTGHPLVVIPTAGGKSLAMASFVEGVLRTWPDQRILIVTHVRELIAQNHAELIGLWRDAPAGIYSAGLGRRDLGALILFAGIQSIHRRAYDVQQCDLVLIDEAHLIPGSSDTMYRRFLDTLARINPQLKVIGFTATPYRLDSGMLHEGKGALFTDIAFEVSVRQLIDDGWLCPLISKAAETRLDVSGVSSRGGEFIPGQLQAAVDLPEVTEAAVDEVVRLGAGRRSWLAFCAGVEHATHVAETIRGRGFSAATIFGDTPKPERDRIVAAFTFANGVTAVGMPQANLTALLLGLGGAVADAWNRLSVNTPAVLLNHAGAGIEATVNKIAAGNDAAFAFKTGFSVRALIGLLGSDDFSFKVSPDGSAYFDAILIDRTSGRVELPKPAILPAVSSAPAAPASGKLALYARTRAGLPWLDAMRAAGREFSLQPHLGLARTANWLPSSGATITTEGMSNTTVGTVSTPGLAATSLATSMRRWRLTSAAVVDSAADQRSGVFTCWRGNAAGLGGWTFVTRMSLATLQATGMAFFGLYGSTAALATTLTSMKRRWPVAPSRLSTSHPFFSAETSRGV